MTAAPDYAALIESLRIRAMRPSGRVLPQPTAGDSVAMKQAAAALADAQRRISDVYEETGRTIARHSGEASRQIDVAVARAERAEAALAQAQESIERLNKRRDEWFDAFRQEQARAIAASAKEQP